MSTAITPAALKPSISTPPGRGLPFLAFFETDDVARKAIVTVHRFRKIPFENLHGHPVEVDRILITASERLLTQFRERMRAQNFRVIALSDDRFKDPRVDGFVFAYLPLATHGELIERIAHAVAEVLRDDTLYQALRENGWNYIRCRFSEEVVAKTLTGVLERSRQYPAKKLPMGKRAVWKARHLLERYLVWRFRHRAAI